MSKIYYFLGHEEFQPEVLVKHAVLAEKAGFDGVFVSEHFNPWVADKGAGGFAFSTLGAIAVKTKNLMLMTGVVSPLFRYHPASVAQAAATLDRLSNGRFELGVGTGEALNEVPLGHNFPDYKERSERMIEALEIIRDLLNGKKISFNGKFYKTKDAKLYSPPVSKVPIFMAAGGPKSAVLAAKYADGLILSVKNIQDYKNELITPALAVNKHLQILASRWSIFAQNEIEAWEALGAWRGLRAPSKGKAHDPQILQNEADKMDRKEILSKYTIASKAQDYLDIYSPLIKELKADIVVIQTATSKNQENLIEFLGKEVVPQLKKL